MRPSINLSMAIELGYELFLIAKLEDWQWNAARHPQYLFLGLSLP